MSLVQDILVAVGAIISFILILGVAILTIIEEHYKHKGYFDKAYKYGRYSIILCAMMLIWFGVGMLTAYALF